MTVNLDVDAKLKP